jgi:hypothetical protein
MLLIDRHSPIHTSLTGWQPRSFYPGSRSGRYNDIDLSRDNLLRCNDYHIPQNHAFGRLSGEPVTYLRACFHFGQGPFSDARPDPVPADGEQADTQGPGCDKRGHMALSHAHHLPRGCGLSKHDSSEVEPRSDFATGFVAAVPRCHELPASVLNGGNLLG